MGSQARGDDSDSVVPFTPAARNAAPDGIDQVDKAGQTILGLLHKAAGVAEANSQHALDLAQKLSHQLRAAEDRIAELEAEVGMFRTKPTARSNGYTGCTPSSRTDFYDRTTAVVERLNAGRVSTTRVEQ
jgi:hypothetical protein